MKRFEPLTALRALRSAAGDGLKAPAVAVYTALALRCDERATCFPSIKTIAADSKVARSSVSVALNVLEEGGWLKRSMRRTATGKSTLYTLTPLAERRRAEQEDRPGAGSSAKEIIREPDDPGADRESPGAGRGVIREPDPICPSDLPIELPTTPPPPNGGPDCRAKGKSTKKPDIAADLLTPAELAVRNAILADESLAPITACPSRLARDLIANGRGVDVVAEVGVAAAWLRANPRRAKKNGNKFLLNWVRGEQERAGRALSAAGRSSRPSPKGQELLEIFSEVRTKSRRGLGLYQPGPDDGAEAARLAAHAGEVARGWAPREQRPEEELFAELVRWWTIQYLRDDGAQGYIANANHPLRFMGRNLSSYGVPWGRARNAAPVLRPIAEPEQATFVPMPAEARVALTKVGAFNGAVPVRRRLEP